MSGFTTRVALKFSGQKAHRPVEEACELVCRLIAMITRDHGISNDLTAGATFSVLKTNL